MAGAGFKTFNTGDVLTASDVNTYLMQQTVMVFADASARSTALGANVSEGMLSYLKSTDVVEVYNGSAWVSSDDPNAIQNTIVDAKGDLISATADNTPARLASSGNNGDVLTVDTSTSTGLKWAAPAGAAANWSLVNAGGTSLTGSGTVTVSGISGANQIFIVIIQGSSASASSNIQFRFNADSGSNYNYAGSVVEAGSTYSSGQFNARVGTSQTSIVTADLSTNAASLISGYCYINGANAAGVKTFQSVMAATAGGGNAHQQAQIGGWYAGTSAITSVSAISGTGNWDAGTIYVYTSAN